jgi:hypothetical protein
MHQHSSHSTGMLTIGLTADSSRCAMQMAQGVAVGTEDDARPAQLPTRPSRLPRNAKAAAAIAISAHVEDHNVTLSMCDRHVQRGRPRGCQPTWCGGEDALLGSGRWCR